MTVVGAHVRSDRPLEAAAAIGADAVQLFLSDPQGWEKPPPRADASELAASDVAVYVHAPYLINVCSPRNNVRFGSRKILQQTCDAAAAVGAEAVIVHGGHSEDGIEAGVERWARSLDRLRTDVRVLIENTAGGTNAVARTWDALARLWDAVGDLGVGFCFDTCHAHAAGEDLSDAVERVLAIVGRIDVVHVNDSKDEFGSGRDRHTKLGTGRIGTDVLTDMLRATKAEVFISETPGTLEELAEDLALIRSAMG
ncbi:MAG TPA: deoxyribonuclease IV [Actinomycetota bacterium]|nr:deoxyribonuclease IV [Actinomycetota bacterium]